MIIVPGGAGRAGADRRRARAADQGSAQAPQRRVPGRRASPARPAGMCSSWRCWSAWRRCPRWRRSRPARTSSTTARPARWTCRSCRRRRPARSRALRVAVALQPSPSTSSSGRRPPFGSRRVVVAGRPAPAAGGGVVQGQAGERRTKPRPSETDGKRGARSPTMRGTTRATPPSNEDPAPAVPATDQSRRFSWFSGSPSSPGGGVRPSRPASLPPGKPVPPGQPSDPDSRSAPGRPACHERGNCGPARRITTARTGPGTANARTRRTGPTGRITAKAVSAR